MAARSKVSWIVFAGRVNWQGRPTTTVANIGVSGDPSPRATLHRDAKLDRRRTREDICYGL